MYASCSSNMVCAGLRARTCVPTAVLFRFQALLSPSGCFSLGAEAASSTDVAVASALGTYHRLYGIY